MAREKRSGERRAPRFETQLWVEIPEVEGAREVEQCNISATGLMLRTRRDVGSLGAVRMLRLVTADLHAGISIMGLVVREVTVDDLEKGQFIEAICFEFLPHDLDELEDFLRCVVEREISATEYTMDRGHGEAEPAMSDAQSVGGMVFETSFAVEAGAKISLEIEGPSSDRALRLSGYAVRSQQTEGSGERERYCVEVSFGQSEERMSSSVAALVDTLVSEAATTDRPAHDRDGVHLSGSLSEVALASLLSFLELEGSSGVLGIETDLNKAAIFIQNGRILDIESESTDSSPIKSLADLLEWPEGAFEFNFQAVERDDTIGKSTTGLLMDCAQLSDERSRQT